MRWLLIALLFTTLSCKKAEPETFEVIYRVFLKQGGPASYNMTYSTGNGVTKTDGPESGALWESPPVLLEDNEAVDFTLNVISGGATFTMEIRKDWALIADSTFSSSIGKTTLQAVI